MDFNVQQFAKAVQRNCDIADAKHGTDYTLCIYLMKMREYYRWESEMGFSERISRELVSDWLVARENHWDSLDEEDFDLLQIGSAEFPPFEADLINDALEAQGLVYGGGLGHSGKPHFFLADLLQHETVEDYTLLVSGKEYARDLASPPAMSLNKTIIIRRESLKRMLWERLENWRWSSPDNAMGRALACYDFQNALDDSLEEMTHIEAEAILWHEMGEIRAGALFGADWERMLADLLATPAELMARAVRDHLADSLVTLPNLMAQNEMASIHFYIGNLSHMRKSLFPALQDAYEQWRNDGNSGPISDLAGQGQQYWLDLGNEMLSIHRKDPEKAAGLIADHAEKHAW